MDLSNCSCLTLNHFFKFTDIVLYDTSFYIKFTNSFLKISDPEEVESEKVLSDLVNYIQPVHFKSFDYAESK